MTLRKRTLISIGLTIIALIPVLYIASRVIVLGSFAVLDIFTRDWAAWDNTYEFIQDVNQDYIEANLVASTFSSAELNFI